MTRRIPLPTPLLVAVLLPALAQAGPALADPFATERLRPLQAELASDDNEPRLYIVQLAEAPAIAEPSLRSPEPPNKQVGISLPTRQPNGESFTRLASRFSATGSAIGQPGNPRTRTRRRASRFDVRAAEVQEYAGRLTAKHDALLEDIGVVDKVYSYRYAFNGFAARMTPAQAQALSRQKTVLGVWEDSFKQVETNASPAFLGLRDSTEGLRTARGLTGEGVVIGIIDSGITPGHASFSDRRDASRPRLCRSAWAESSLLGLWLCQRFKNRDDEVLYEPPEDWNGICQAGEEFSASDCNNKLIGARFYIDGFLDGLTPDDNEFRSPRDADGHGTHIASVAAGNRVPASLGGTEVATIEGMAPRARIAVYKACWLLPGSDRGDCSVADLTRAIEDAVADGVDIINYSVGSFDDIDGPDDLALLAAADTGILTVAAAGNEGPMPGTMISPAAAPWIVAVGASSRTGDHFDEALRVDEPPALAGTYAAVEAAFTPTLRSLGGVSGELVLVDDSTITLFVNPPSVGTTWDACEPITNAEAIDGNIALIQRGGCDFVDKILNAENAGAAAVVIASQMGDPEIMRVPADTVNVPAVMIGREDGVLLREELLAGAVVELTLDKSIVMAVRDTGNVMEGFSARGPNEWAPDILKPDVTAPGVEILGAQSPDVANGVRGESFQYLSGTSMAVPHVAGIAALLKEAHPEWSPAALKSALVTSARQDVLREDGETAEPFDFGGGHVAPNRAVDPGLVYDASLDDFDAFLCGLGTARPDVDCTALEAAGYPTRAVDLNLPSIAVSRFVHDEVIHRQVTNVGEAGQYSATVEAPTGVGIEVSPSILNLDAGETADFEIRMADRGAEADAWHFGALTWSDGTRTVRSPIAVQPTAMNVPSVLQGSGASGTMAFSVRTGFQGVYSATVAGIDASGHGQSAEVQAALRDIELLDDPGNAYEFVPLGDSASLPPHVHRVRIEVPEGTVLLRVSLFDEDTSGADDLDLYLFQCPGFTACEAELGMASEGSSDESITLLEPEPGQYVIDVHAYNTERPSTTFDLSVWTLGPDRNNATLSGPASVAPGDAANVTLAWQSLAAGRNLGLILHGDGSDTLALSLVDIRVVDSVAP